MVRRSDETPSSSCLAHRSPMPSRPHTVEVRIKDQPTGHAYRPGWQSFDIPQRVESFLRRNCVCIDCDSTFEGKAWSDYDADLAAYVASIRVAESCEYSKECCEVGVAHDASSTQRLAGRGCPSRSAISAYTSMRQSIQSRSCQPEIQKEQMKGKTSWRQRSASCLALASTGHGRRELGRVQHAPHVC